MNRIVHSILVLAFGISLLWSQTSRRTFSLNQELTTGVTFQTWKSDRGDRVSEFSAPVIYLLPVTSSLTLDIMTSGGSAELKNPNETIGGLTDTRIRATYGLFDETLVLTAGVSLPTGVNKLKTDQYLVAASISHSALDFRVGSFGQGTDVNAGIVYAVDLESVVIGFGAGGLLKGKFKPLDGFDFEYKPGNELTATIGVDKTFDLGRKGLTTTLDVSYTRYGADQYNGEEVFRSGNKIAVDLQLLFQAGSLDFLIFGQNRTKGKNERGIGSLSPEETNSNGNQTDAGLIAALPLGETTRLKGLFDTKQYARNESGNNGARIFGGGAGIEFQLFRTLGVDLSAKYLVGKLQFAAGETAITGIEVSLGFIFLP